VTPERESLYRNIGRRIGRTPLCEIRNIEIPNGNRIFAKEEYLNPTGSHYDRVFWQLLLSLESDGTICPCQELVETTSGNAGASFAWLCSALGYRATVIIPEDMPNARLAQIKSFGARVVTSPRGLYVVGAIDTLRSYLKDRKSRGELVYCTNHVEADASIAGMDIAACEVKKQLRNYRVDELDLHVSALGGGITLRGLGEGLKLCWPSMKIFGVEPVEEPEYYYRKHPQGPGFSFPKIAKPHDLLGIGRWGSDCYKFRHMEKMLNQVEEVLLIERHQWMATTKILQNQEAKHVGRTSAAALWAALELANRVEKKNILILFYDPSWKYLNIT
jgi:cysteine synthase A